MRSILNLGGLLGRIFRLLYMYATFKTEMKFYLYNVAVIMYRLDHEVDISAQFTHQRPQDRGCVKTDTKL